MAPDRIESTTFIAGNKHRPASDRPAADVDRSLAAQVTHRLARQHLDALIDQTVADFGRGDFANILLVPGTDGDHRDAVAGNQRFGRLTERDRLQKLLERWWIDAFDPNLARIDRAIRRVVSLGVGLHLVAALDGALQRTSLH